MVTAKFNPLAPSRENVGMPIKLPWLSNKPPPEGSGEILAFVWMYLTARIKCTPISSESHC